MRILINTSGLKAGGGLQVGDSLCGQLYRFPQHQFVVVLSTSLAPTGERIKAYPNVEVFSYDISNTFRNVVLGRDVFLDQLVEAKRINVVLSVFGPARWRPRVPHLSGFAMAFLVMPESPFFSKLSMRKRVEQKVWCSLRKWGFGRYSDYLWTENPFISARLTSLYPSKKIYTVGNYYHQIFDEPQKWRKTRTLPPFRGVTCLSVASPYLHKNFEIIPAIIRLLKEKKPDFKLRFALTFSYEESNMSIPEEIRDNIVFIGKTDVSECPYLYEQSDIMFMPTLLECFTATYPEAMRMERPIVTTDLEFARGLCGEAACYYSAADAEAAAEAIYRVATDEAYRGQLVANGKEQLKKFDNYEQRAEKLMKILEEIQGEA